MNKYTKISLVLIVLCAIAYFLVSFRLENIEIKNDSIYSDEEIKEKLIGGSKLDAYTYFFAWRINRGAGKKIPFVEKADVEVIDKNSVIIYVYGKAVIGCVEHMGSYMHFDREGTVVESSPEPLEGIPLIEGLRFDNIVNGRKLEMGDSDLYSSLMELLGLLEKNDLKAEKLRYGIRGDCTLFTDGNEVLLGTTGNMDYKINNLSGIIKALNEEQGEGPYRIDMRTYSEDQRELTARKIEDVPDTQADFPDTEDE